MTSTPLLKPIKTLRENISNIEVAKYYLEIEFSKLFKNVEVSHITETIEKLSDSKIWALLEAMSFTYHLNGVFFKLAREGYTWNEEIWNVGDVLLTEMDPNVNKIIFSEEVKGDALKFKHYLTNYFETNPTSDPQKLFSYKPTNRELKYPTLIAIRKDTKIAKFDCSHKLIELLLNGTK